MRPGARKFKRWIKTLFAEQGIKNQTKCYPLTWRAQRWRLAEPLNRTVSPIPPPQTPVALVERPKRRTRRGNRGGIQKEERKKSCDQKVINRVVKTYVATLFVERVLRLLKPSKAKTGLRAPRELPEDYIRSRAWCQAEYPEEEIKHVMNVNYELASTSDTHLKSFRRYLRAYGRPARWRLAAHHLTIALGDIRGPKGSKYVIKKSVLIDGVKFEYKG